MIRLVAVTLTFLAAVTSVVVATTNTQDATASRRFTPEQLREDLVFLRTAVSGRHPRWHDDGLGADLEREFVTVANGIGQPMDRAEAFRLFARLNPYFEDAHTLLMPTGVAPQSQDGAGFPFGVRLDARDKLRLRLGWHRPRDGAELPAGTEILAINGVPTRQLLDDLARYGHGETAPLRRHMLTVMFSDWLGSVRGWSRSFELLVDDAGHQRQLILAPGDDWTSTTSSHRAYAPSLDLRADGIARLLLPTFDVDEDPGAYRDAVDAIFATLRRDRAKALIIDVRGNTGGQSEAGAQVIRYLIDHPVNQVSHARERLNEDNNGLLGYRGAIGGMREMDLSRDGLVEPAPAGLRFQGPVVLLVDAMTYSAAILFATTLQDHDLALLIGQATGGHANQTGNMTPVHLPNTGLMVYIPAREFVRPNGDRRLAPIIPDRIAEPPTSDTDPALEQALRHLAPLVGSGVIPPA